MVARKNADFDPCQYVNKTIQIMPNLCVNLIRKSQIFLSTLRGALQTNSEIPSLRTTDLNKIYGNSYLFVQKIYNFILPIKNSTGLKYMVGVHFYMGQNLQFFVQPWFLNSFLLKNELYCIRLYSNGGRGGVKNG